MSDNMNNHMTLDQDQIKAFVLAGHNNLEAVKTMLAEQPQLLEASFTWGQRQDGSPDNESALQAAAHMGRRDIALFLLAAGARLDVTTAAMLGDVAAVEVFLAADSNAIAAKGAHDIALLTHAAMSGDSALVGYLIEQGATTGASMALNIAVSSGDLAMVQLLLAKTTPDLTWKNFRGKTALDLAADQPELLALLAGAD
jgi:uncharacterized protein